MIKCPSCGTYVDESQKFCTYCGAPLNLEQEGAPTVATQDQNAPVPADPSPAAPPVPEDPEKTVADVTDTVAASAAGAVPTPGETSQTPPLPNSYQQTQTGQQVPPAQNAYQQVPPTAPSGYQQVPPTPNYASYDRNQGGGNGFGIASLVCGIISIFLGAFTGIPGIILGIIALVLGILGIKKCRSKGFGIAGLITGIIGAVIGIIVLLIALWAVNTVVNGGMEGINEIMEEFGMSVDENGSLQITPDESSGIIESTPSSVEESQSESSAEAPAVTKELSIPETLIFNQENVKITATGFERDMWDDPSVLISIENGTDKTITISSSAICVNNYLMNRAYMYESITPGNKVNTKINMTQSDLDIAGIENPGAIDMTFSVYDTDTYDALFTGEIETLKTSLYDEMDIPQITDGDILVEQDDILMRISPELSEDESGNLYMPIYLENNRTSGIYVYEDNTSLNGTMVDAYGSWTLPGGKRLIDYVKIYLEDLQAAGIENAASVQNGEINFILNDESTWDTIVKTEVYKFSRQ